MSKPLQDPPAIEDTPELARREAGRAYGPPTKADVYEAIVAADPILQQLIAEKLEEIQHPPQRRIQSTTVYADGSQNVAGIIAADVVGVRELVPGVAFFYGAIVITFNPERGVEMGAALLEGEGAPTWWTAFANHVEQVIRAQLEAASRRAEAAAMVQRAEGRAGFEVGGKLVHAATCPDGTQRGARCNCDTPVVAP